MQVIIARDGDGCLSAWKPKYPPIKLKHYIKPWWQRQKQSGVTHWASINGLTDGCFADDFPNFLVPPVAELFGKGCFGVKKGRKKLLNLKKISKKTNKAIIYEKNMGRSPM